MYNAHAHRSQSRLMHIFCTFISRCVLSLLGLIAVAGTAYEFIVMEFIPKFKNSQKHETPEDPNFSNWDGIESSIEKPYILRHANGGSPESTQKQNVKENTKDDTLKPKNGDTKEKRSTHQYFAFHRIFWSIDSDSVGFQFH